MHKHFAFLVLHEFNFQKLHTSRNSSPLMNVAEFIWDAFVDK